MRGPGGRPNTYKRIAHVKGQFITTGIPGISRTEFGVNFTAMSGWMLTSPIWLIETVHSETLEPYFIAKATSGSGGDVQIWGDFCPGFNIDIFIYMAQLSKPHPFIETTYSCFGVFFRLFKKSCASNISKCTAGIKVCSGRKSQSSFLICELSLISKNGHRSTLNPI